MFGELHLKYHVGLHHTVKNIQHNGTEAYYPHKNVLYLIFILLVNSFYDKASVSGHVTTGQWLECINFTSKSGQQGHSS
jgi:hypothetical protein